MKSRILICVSLIIISSLAIAQTSNVITKMYLQSDPNLSEASDFNNRENVGAYTKMDVIAGTYQWQVRIISPSGNSIVGSSFPNPPLITSGGTFFWQWNFNSFNEVGQYTTEFLIDINKSGFKVYSTLKFNVFKSNCPTKGALIPANAEVCEDQPIMLTLNIDDGIAPFHATISARNILTNGSYELVEISDQFNFKLGPNTIIINPGDQNYLPIGEYTLSATVQNSDGFDTRINCTPTLQLKTNLKVTPGICNKELDSIIVKQANTLSTNIACVPSTFPLLGVCKIYSEQNTFTSCDLITSYIFIETNNSFKFFFKTKILRNNQILLQRSWPQNEITAAQGSCFTFCTQFSFDTPGSYDVEYYIVKEGKNEEEKVASSSFTILDNHPDYLDLMKLYNSTGGPNWTSNTGWKEGAAGINCDPCTWYGIKCENNRVVVIDLDGKLDFSNEQGNLVGNNLMGSLPNFNVPFLELLSFGADSIYGNLPNYKLDSLKVLSVHNSKLSGIIPLLDLPNLEFLALNDNELEGAIPNYNLPNLRALQLSGNLLSGSIPNFNLPNLRLLLLGSNKLSGKIPSLNIPKITRINLSNNNLSGCIPPIFKNYCANIIEGNISNNPLLLTQSWNDFCNNQSGLCICTHPDFAELIKLYNSTDGPNWTNNTGWKEGAAGTNCDLCTWYGIKCDNNRVICIDLDGDSSMCNIVINSANLIVQPIGNRLKNKIPNLQFEKLESLSLAGNELSDTIPNFNLPKLRELYLFSNKLEGKIPNFNLPNLEIVFLYNNFLSGNIPNFDLPKLTWLYLGNNLLSGEIPNFNLPSLTSLWLVENELSGSIPNFNLPNLRRLDLSNNKLSGKLPSLILPKITIINLSNNNLSGCIPPIFKNYCANITEGNISNNPLLQTQSWNDFCKNQIGLCCTHPDFADLMKLYNSTGGPNWTNNTGWKEGAAGSNCDPCRWYGISCENNRVIKIELDGKINGTLDLNEGGNNLVGQLPNLFFEKLQVLNIARNSISGTLPNFTMPEIKKIQIPSNQLIGPIPKFNQQLLEEIYLQYNNLTGNIPDYSLPNLKVLDIGGNPLTGNIPSNFNLPNLEFLSLGGSKISGVIPNLNFPKLRYLWLHEANLSGPIPLFNFPLLEVFNLYNNKLSGSIPLLNFPKLNSFNVNTNQLTSFIPNLNFPNLQYLDLSKNNLEGCIPTSFKKNCGNLSYSDISNNPLLSTQSWDDFCNSNKGICCFKPLVQDFDVSGLINEDNKVELKNYGSYPEKSYWKITDVMNNQLKELEISIDGVLTYSFDKHYFGEVEIAIEACGLDCNECDNFVVKITDTYLPYIFPTNVISPDGDGIDEVLKFNDDGEIFDSELTVFNRWGDVIYRKKQYSNDWDANGYPGGVYFYALKVKDVIFKSTLTIIK